MMISTVASQGFRLSLKEIAVVRRAQAVPNLVVAAVAESNRQQIDRCCSKTLSFTGSLTFAQFSAKAGAPKLSYFERKQQAKEDLLCIAILAHVFINHVQIGADQTHGVRMDQSTSAQAFIKDAQQV